MIVGLRMIARTAHWPPDGDNATALSFSAHRFHNEMKDDDVTMWL